MQLKESNKLGRGQSGEYKNLTNSDLSVAPADLFYSKKSCFNLSALEFETSGGDAELELFMA